MPRWERHIVSYYGTSLVVVAALARQQPSPVSMPERGLVPLVVVVVVSSVLCSLRTFRCAAAGNQRRVGGKVSIFRAPLPSGSGFRAADVSAATEGLTNVGATPFAILTMPRSASSTLVSQLHAHPAVECHREAFHSRKVYTRFAKREGPSWTVDRRDADRATFLRRLYARESNRTTAVGFKLFATHLTLPEFQALVSSYALRKVVLRRDDVLAEYASLLRGVASGRWRRDQRDQRRFFFSSPRPWAATWKSKDKRVRVAPDAFLAFADLHRRWYDRLAAEAAKEASSLVSASKPSSSSWLFVATEDLLRGGRASADALATIARHLNVAADPAFLNLSHAPYAADLALRDKISNYDQLRDALRAHPDTRHLAPPK